MANQPSPKKQRRQTNNLLTFKLSNRFYRLLIYLHVCYQTKTCIDYFQLCGLFPRYFPPFRQTRAFLVIRYARRGKVLFHQNFLLEDTNIDHSDNSNHRWDNVSKKHVDIPYPQTNESCSSVKTTLQQDCAPTNQRCKCRHVYRSIAPSFIIKSTRSI
jgi:hypothetical protein